MIATIKHAIGRLWRSVRGGLLPAWRVGVTWVTRVTRTVYRLWSGVRARHEQRMDSDPSYPIALVAGLTAGFGVLVGHPAVAAGVGLAAGEILGVRTTHDRRTYPGPRYPAPPSRWDDDRPSRPLWDRDDWDE